MRESMQRIVTWAKAHPWLAALIVGLVILLGYLVYKRSSSGGGARDEAAGFELGEGTGAVSPIPADMGGISSPVTSGGLSTIPSTDLGLGVSGAQTQTPIPAASVPVFSAADLTGFGGAGWTPPAIGTLTGQLTSPKPPASLTSGGIPTRKVEPGSTRLRGEGTFAPEEVEVAKPAVRTSARVPRAIAAARTITKPSIMPRTSARVPRAAAPKQTAPRTPAELRGLSRYYTGIYGGVRYVLGYPAFGSIISTGTTGGGSGRR